MAAAGVELVGHIDSLSVMGLVEGIKTLPSHARLLRAFRERASRRVYNAVLLIDYPGLHLRLASVASTRGLPVVYYIAPQVWAWGRGRLKHLRQYVRHLAVVLPFEQAFFAQHGIASTFVGHPLLDGARGPDRSSARQSLGLAPDAQVVAVFPGVRDSERRRLWPVFLETVRRLQHDLPRLEPVIAGTVAHDEMRVASPAQALAAADACLCKSGTTTLEAALADRPMVVAYRMNPVTYAVARWTVQVPHVSLVNLVAGRQVVPEFLQADATPVALARELLTLLEPNGSASRAQRAGFSAVRGNLGRPGAAHRVASLTLEHAA
jgi:lipid-A-disaccharide synthase